MFRPLVDRPGTVSTCPNCRQPFKLADSPHAPLILNCRHVCCEECIRTAFCTERHIICKECGMSSSSKPSLDVKLSNLRESFPLSEKMIEEINKLTQMKPVDESSIGFKSSKRRNCVEKPSPNSSLHEDACKECRDVVAILKCSDCNALLCQDCFHAIHKFKTNRKHTYVFLQSTSSNVMDKEKKSEYVKQLREFREKLTKKQERIERSLKMLKNPELVKEAQSSGIDVQQVHEDLKNFFLYCQNAIKGLENEVIQQFEAIAYSLENSQKKCQKALQQSQTEIVAVLKDLCKISATDFFDASNVEKLLVLSRDLLEKPDTIQTKRPIKGKEKIEMPSGDWLQILESQMIFDFGQPGEICLVKNTLESDDVDICDSTTAPLMIPSGTSDIGDTFERTSHSSLTLSERSAANHQNSERRPSKTLSVQLPMYSNGEYCSGDVRRCESVNGMNRHFASNPCSSRGRFPSPVQVSGPSSSQCCMAGPSRNPYNPKTSCSRANSGRPERFTEGWKGTVVVSCVYTPSCFYVQLDTGLLTLEKYRKFFKAAVKGPPIEKKDIQIGNNMYLAECSDGEWYRIRIHEVSSSDRSVLVTQVDTGKKETVDVSKIFHIEDVLRSAAFETELAIQCCIHNCCPIASTWRKEDIELFTETLQNRKLTMTVFKVQPSKLEVDLEWNENGSHTTIRNYMLECRNACIAIQKENQSTIASHETLKYFRDDRFSVKEWVDVSVTFVFGPHELYVKRIDSCSEEISEKMNKSIDAFYKQPSNYKQYLVATPSIGLPVAAQFSADNTWYRAEILNTLPQSKKAEVLYVDFGNKETLTFSRIRLLAKEFTKNTLRAVKCSLAGIKPAIGSKYKPASTELLIQNVENKTLKMIVEEVRPNGLSVVLYRSDEDKDVCINSLLIDAEFAKKVGNVLGAASSYPKKSNVSTKQVMIMKKAATKENQPDTPQKANSEKSQVSENTLKDTEVQETGAESLNEHIEDDECKNSSCDDIAQAEDFDNLADDKKNIRYEVKMISFISPNLFYVSLVQQVANVQETIRNMAKFYREKKDSPEWILPSVEKDVRCAAYSEKDDKWYRAKVTEVKENDEVVVFFKDIARAETVKKEHLYSLDPNFNKLVDGTVACHMINIEERSDWPEAICESLKNSLDSYTSVHVAKMDKKENTTSHPVVLWGKTVACRGAFAPATEEWTNINELVMKALQNDDLVELDPEHNKDNQSQKESGRSLDDDIGEISSTETVKKWLHCNAVDASEKGVRYGSILANGGTPHENVNAAKSPTNLSAVALNTVKTLQIYSEETSQPDWKPALPVDSEEFEVWATYLDDDACFYLQNMAKQRKVIALISNTLQTKFENSTPSPHDMHWYPGQICIAWFYLDKKWYRGRVLKVEDSKAQVEYVDFGNVEWVEFANLRKDIILENFPIQCHKFPIRSDVVPLSDDGKWSDKTLDFVHHSVVEKRFIVKLKKEKGENFPRIQKLTWVETEVELFEYLRDAGFIKFTGKADKTPKKTNVDSKNEENHDDDDDRNDSKSNSSSSIAKYDSVSNLDLSEFLEVPGATLMINDPFSIPQNPQENEVVVPFFDVPVNDLSIVIVEVIEILQLDEIVVHIVDSDNVAVNENRENFVKMNSELQQKGKDQDVLKSPSLGRMCCTQFDDGVWYRAKIIDLDEENDKVNILYVDYGNSSRADPSSLYEMKRSWFDVPMQSIRCKLADFAGIVSDGKEPDVEEMLPLINKRLEAVLEACEEDSMLYKIQLFFK